MVGIEKSYVVLESDNKLMIEYSSGKGRAMTLGAFVFFARPNAKHLHLRKFLENTISYLLEGDGKTPATCWLPSENKPKPFRVSTAPAGPAGRLDARRLPASGPMMSRTSPRDNFYDVAGRRALVMGRENGGIDELWVHPFRVLRDFQAALVRGDTLLWLKNLPVSVKVRPESFTRSYATPFGALREIVYPSLTKAGALVHYEFEKPPANARLVVTFRSDLRWMWPYDERALGDVYYAWDDALHAFHVRDKSSDFYCVMGADRAPVAHLTGPFAGITWRNGRLAGEPTTANQAYQGAVYAFGPAGQTGLTVALVGTDMGRKEALAHYSALLSRPAHEYAALVAHYKDLLARSVTVASPDTEFNALWQWALVGTDRFVTTTPRLGTALVAGLSTTDRGWDGGQKISGRPGYAWYFGRDSEWSGFAIDDYGDLPAVRQQLAFLEKYQDLTGKIFHEVSTSGVVHYDAADATPLYIILAAHYLRASGDLDCLRSSWPHLEKAMEFLYSTDTDGDGLIENTDVGHGWVEGGKLWPVHTEFYLAGIWGQALDDAAWMASLLGKKDLASRYGQDAATVKKKVDTDFWNDTTQCYNYGKLIDGSYNPEPTVLPAPVEYFGWLSDEKVLPGLARYATDAFTADWGVRIVGSGSPLFNPTGYHYGSVWPLFTGWTALAEYEYGRSDQAFAHMLGTMDIKNHWALGFVQEVMNGAVYKPSGVCPHQCWSETNILHPGIHGMIGWSPRATEHAARLAPRFPVHWNRVTVRNLRAGASVLDLTMERSRHLTAYRLTLKEGTPLAIELSPEFPLGTELITVSVNGKAVPLQPGRQRGLIAEPVRFALTGTAEVRFTCVGGVGVIPNPARPAPDDSSGETRIIGTSLNGAFLTIDMEGKSGSSVLVRLEAFDQNVVAVKDGTLVGEAPGGLFELQVPFPRAGSSSGSVRKQVSVQLTEIPR